MKINSYEYLLGLKILPSDLYTLHSGSAGVMYDVYILQSCLQNVY